MTLTIGLRQLISLRLPWRYSLNAFSRSWSSSRIASGESDCLSAAANGFLERSFPVILAYFSKASVTNRMLEVEDVEDVEDVACSADDMKATDRLLCFVQRGWFYGRENKGSGYELMGESRMQTAQGCGTPTRSDL